MYWFIYNKTDPADLKNPEAEELEEALIHLDLLSSGDTVNDLFEGNVEGLLNDSEYNISENVMKYYQKIQKAFENEEFPEDERVLLKFIELMNEA